MKNYFYLLLISFFILSCGNTEYTEENLTDLIDAKNPPILSFDEPVFEFGTVIEGEVIKHKFTFTNTGKTPLLISSFSKECGCTVTRNWTREQIKPGENGFIDVEFNSEGFPGNVVKRLTVASNTKPAGTIITLKGTVIGPTN